MNILSFLPLSMQSIIGEKIEVAKKLGLYYDKCYFCCKECKKANIIYCENMIVNR